MKSLLSIVIPCYNCADTLRESVSSCFSGGLDNFEIIMVDDGSSDTTKEVMTELSKKYKEITLFYHEHNRGGGAARNTGIQHAIGDLIFCLDSDNVLDATSMQKMVMFLREKKVDGVAFYERRFFHSQRRETFTSHFNTVLNKSITIENIFDSSETLLDNFLYTKESFLRTTKYPEHHGFDTQSFEMRYLSVNNSVFVCPETFFYHRQNHKQPSYFEREFNKGNFSVNCYLAVEDIWFLFSEKAKKEILEYDIFTNSNLNNNLLRFLKVLYSKGYLFVFQDSENSKNNTVSSFYNDFILYYQNKEYDKALEICKKILENKLDSKIIYFSLLRAGVGLSGVESNFIEKKVREIIDGLITKPKILNKWYHRNLLTLKGVQLIQKVWKH
jgi:glycosyltransferase involved in cell wall biosynthesis